VQRDLAEQAERSGRPEAVAGGAGEGQPFPAQVPAAAGSLERASCARPTKAAPWTWRHALRIEGQKESSHSPPSAKTRPDDPACRTPVQIRSPASASASVRHQLSTCHTFRSVS
jgi:hypothetical protein